MPASRAASRRPPARRRGFVPLYFGSWALVIVHLAWALAARAG